MRMCIKSDYKKSHKDRLVFFKKSKGLFAVNKLNNMMIWISCLPNKRKIHFILKILKGPISKIIRLSTTYKIMMLLDKNFSKGTILAQIKTISLIFLLLISMIHYTLKSIRRIN